MSSYDCTNHILIDASAGTGKTYTLMEIFEDLLNQGINPKKILMITFSLKSTDELKERAFKVIDDDKKKHTDKPEIFSIHSFFYKIIKTLAPTTEIEIDEIKGKEKLVLLGKNKLESYHQGQNLEGKPFTRETLPYFLKWEDESLSRWDNDKYWEGLFIELVTQIERIDFLNQGQKLSPIIPSIISKEKMSLIFQEIEKHTQAIGDIYKKNGEELVKFGHKGIHPKFSVLGGLSQDSKNIFDKIGDFLKEFIQNKSTVMIQKGKINKGGEHLFPVVEEIEKYIAELKRLIIPLQYQVTLSLVYDVIQDPKAQSFNNHADIVNEANRLIVAYRENIQENLFDYEYVFIDEFQDTSLQEWETIKATFFKTHIRTSFVIVGDKKQAIYGFKGGNVYAYLNAQKELIEDGAKSYVLNQNFRTSKNLLPYFNAIFSSPSYFGKEYTPLKGKVEDVYGAANLNIIEYKIPEGQGINDSKINLACYYARQIRELKKNHPLQTIAILARTKSDLRLVQEELEKNGIAHYLHKSQNIFRFHIAQSLYFLLKALHPLATYGDKQLMPHSLFFKGKKDLSLLSIMQMQCQYKNWGNLYHSILYQTNIAENIKKNDFEVLKEILQKLFHFAIQNNAEIEIILDKFNAESHKEAQIREQEDFNVKESREVVQLMTIHKSKGLEFDIIFLFFSDVFFNRKASQSKTKNLKKENEPSEIIFKDFLTPEMEEEIEAQEQLDSKNLFYVGITRSKFNCFIPIFRDKKERTNYLIESLDELKSNFGGISTESLQFISLSEELLNHSENDAEILVQNKTEIPFWLKNKSNMSAFYPKIKKNFSFTSLSKKDLMEESEEKEIEIDIAEKENLSLIEDFLNPFFLPKGSDTGILMHSLLENLKDELLTSFNEKDFLYHLKNYVMTHLKQKAWKDFCLDNLKNRNQIRDHFFLSHKIESLFLERQKKEFENEFKEVIPFFKGEEGIYALQFFEILKNLLETTFPNQSKPLKDYYFTNSIQEVKLFYDPQVLMQDSINPNIEGVLDFIFKNEQDQFFIIDWKTNYLSKGYSLENIKDEVDKTYALQIEIYWVLLTGFLESQLQDFNYEKHMGGLYYVFLRGLKSKEKGIYQRIISYEEYKKMKENLSENLKRLNGGSYVF